MLSPTPENEHMINYVALLNTNAVAYNMLCTQHMLHAPVMLNKTLQIFASNFVSVDIFLHAILCKPLTEVLLSITMTLMTYKHLAG